jgi:basic membrane lipoprotein Med (substrate-binding protein (PBP1-ABC) superfamily)
MRTKHLLPLLAALALAGCSAQTGSGDPAAKGTSGTADASGDFKVALLTPGPVSDAGWSAMAYDGLQSIKKEMNATVDNQEATGPKIKDAMRSYAQKGYGLVFGHGFEYNSVGVVVAKDFPNTVFISSSGGETAANAGAFRFYLEQGFYLAGMMAAKMSKTGTVGSVAAIKVPSIDSTLKAFVAGAKAAKPDIKVIPTVYLGDQFQSDVAKAQQATESVIAQGADFIIHQANAAAPGVFNACAAKNVYAFGSNADQNNASPAVIGSAVIVAGPAFLDLAKQVKDKSFKGSVVLKGMQDSAIDFVISPAHQNKVPPALVKELEDTKAKIKSGQLVVPKDEF